MIEFISNTNNKIEETTYLTLGLPEGVKVGDLLLSIIGVRVLDNSDLILSSTGWTVIDTAVSDISYSPFLIKIFILYKFVTSIEEQVYVFQGDSVDSKYFIGCINAYRGVINTNFIDHSIFENQDESSNFDIFSNTTVEDTIVVAGVFGYNGIAADTTYDPIITTLEKQIRYQENVHNLSGIDLCFVVVDAYKTRKETETIVFRVDPSTDINHVGFILALIPAPLVKEFTDTYKSKLLRGMLPSPYNSTLSESSIANLFSVVGASDNDIGGLFGEDDFLE